MGNQWVKQKWKLYYQKNNDNWVQQVDFTEKIIIGDKSNIKEAIRNLYRILRDCDILGIENIFIEETEEKGLAFSYMNRLKKAGSYNFLKRS